MPTTAVAAETIPFDASWVPFEAPAAPQLEATAEEQKRVLGMLGAVEYAREFDCKARKDYAFCRRYARGDSSYEVSVNLIGTYIDIMVSFLYARDPDIDCMPADRIEAQDTESGAMPLPPVPGMGPGGQPMPIAPPPGSVPGMGGAPMDPAALGLPAPGMVPPGAPIDPLTGGALAPPMMLPQPTQQDSSLSDLKTYGRTMEICLSRAWKDMKMKRQAERVLRGALTTGIGWFKTGWQEIFETDPAITDRVRTLQENLARVRALRQSIAAGGDGDLEDEEAELAAQLKACESDTGERLTWKGLFLDVVPGEDIQVSLDVASIVDIEGAGWIAHRLFMQIDLAKAKYPRLSAEDWAKAGIYHAIKPLDYSDSDRNTTPAAADENDIDASRADRFRKGSDLSTTGGANRQDRYVCVWEKWKGEDNRVYTLIEGVSKFAEEPAEPNVPTTRFYPFFPLALHEVDGERHPQSLVMRSYKLVDEYNHNRTGIKKLRQRTKPRIAFDARAFDTEEIKKIVDGAYAEWIPIKPSSEAGLPGAVWEVPYPKIDAALFDVTQIKNELEILWGIQEALASGSLTPKTATEAEIQQAGTNARTGSMRDKEEGVLTEMAQYHAEILCLKYTTDDARDIAGPGALWIEGLTIQDLGVMMNIEIRAGSTGKPNTTQQREAWAAEAPVIRDSIMQIGQLLGSPPQEIARCLKEVLIETIERSGDRIDIDRFLPKGGMPMMPMMGAPGGTLGAPAGGPLPMPGGGVDPMNPQGTMVAPTGLPELLQ